MSLYVTTNINNNSANDAMATTLMFTPQDHNKLAFLPASMWRAFGLAVLCADHNELAELPPNLHHLPALHTLHVAHNQLQVRCRGCCM